MPTKKKIAINLKLGDRVRILHSTGMKGRIVELRGPLGPGGAQIYRVQYQRKPKPAYIEVREDQLELLPQSNKKPAPTDKDDPAISA
jgi:hypothetical protein